MGPVLQALRFPMRGVHAVVGGYVDIIGVKRTNRELEKTWLRLGEKR